MKITKGLKFTDKKKKGKYKVSSLSRKKNTVYIFDRKYKITFKLPLDILESYLEGEND